MNYNFSDLSDIDFEHMVIKLLNGKKRVVEQYAKGRDGGVDGKSFDIPEQAQIQVKHYLKSGFNLLKNKVEREELPKIQNKGVPCYILATSFDLSQRQAEILRSIINKEVSKVIVLGYTSICNLLDSDPATLKSTIKLWATNAELVRQILKPSNINCFYELQNRWENLNRVFVETPDVKNVIDSLEKNHVALIAGEPGVGKTTLAEYICLLYYKEGYEVHFFEGAFSHDDYDLSDTKKKIIFYFDDFLGSTYYNCFSGKKESEIVNFLNRISKEKNKRFILTSRTNILHKACLYSEKYQDYRLAKKAYIVNVGVYSDSIKARILYNHLCNSNVGTGEIADLVKNKTYWTIIKHRNFNPRLIHFVTKQENFEDSQQECYLSFINNSLDNPNAIWEKCFTKHLDSSQRLLVKLVVANREKIKESTLKNAYSKALILMGIKTPEQERNDYEYVLSGCLRSILRRDIETFRNSKDTFVSVFNPSVSDYVLHTILERDIITKLSLALGTIGSIEVIEYNNKKIVDVQSIYRVLLDDCPKNEWTDVKIRLINLMGSECGLVPDLIETVMSNVDLVTDDNKLDLYYIVLDNLCRCDFSDFLMCCVFLICDTYQDFGEILKGYNDSPYVDHHVVELLQEYFFESLEENIESILVNETDAFICTSCEDVEAELEYFLEDILDDYPFLTKRQINKIRKKVNFQRIVDRNQEFFDSLRKDAGRKNEQKNINDIDDLFNQLL